MSDFDGSSSEFIGTGGELTAAEETWVQQGALGALRLLERTAPSTVASTGLLYVKSSDNLLYFKNSSGVESAVSLGASTPTVITVANEATDATCFPLFVTAATGDLGPKTNAGLAFNSATGVLTATGFSGPLTGNVTGNASGTAATVTTAAQPSITSLGTLTTLTVDDITINGNTISSAGASTLAITPTAGQAITLDGTVTIDAGVVAGMTSLTMSGNIIMGTNSITMTGSIAATGARVTKGWFTDVESTNMFTVGGTSLASTFAAIAQTFYIGTTQVAINRSSAALTLAGITLTTPDIGTPSAGVLTNATGLPAGAILPGTLVAGTYLLAENASIGLDPAGSADGKYSGITITGVAGYAQAFGDLVYLAVADSRWEKTDADALATAGNVLIGMVVVAGGSDGAACTILLQGQIRADTAFPALTVGAGVFVSDVTAGAIQVAIPTGADNVIRVVGFALTDSEIYFNPSQDHQTTVA